MIIQDICKGWEWRDWSWLPRIYWKVGSGEIDHDYPGRPEDMNITRPAFKLTPEKVSKK